MISSEYVCKNLHDDSLLFNAQIVGFGYCWVWIATLVNFDSESVDNVLWDMADSQSSIRNFKLRLYLIDRQET